MIAPMERGEQDIAREQTLDGDAQAALSKLAGETELDSLAA